MNRTNLVFPFDRKTFPVIDFDMENNVLQERHETVAGLAVCRGCRVNKADSGADRFRVDDSEHG